MSIDFERPSNVGSLIGAVLVGLLALAANHYIRMDTKWLQELVEQHNRPKPKRTEVAADLPFDAAGVRKRIQSIESEWSEDFTHWRRSGRGIPRDELLEKRAEVDRLVESIRSHKTLDAELERGAQMARLRIYFMTAERFGDQYSDEFVDLAKEIEQTETDQASAEASALRFFHLEDFRSPDDQKLLDKLREFSVRTMHTPGVGVQLYSSVAHELCRFGQTTLAERVLDQGVEVYAGSSGISRLINQRLDQLEMVH